jgi:Uma2 family endonuclease
MTAPEVCVEVLSMSNSDIEMKEKRKLYFERGAKEVWICDEYGNISFYNPKRKISKSAMFPDFPKKIEI